ncbi:MAG TPA: bifunctional 4-hydroxy-2-oxoglutarate aldolase/2-dehydro-3-deoxy-phosphogluconate aldolase [Terriglobales bacterium]|nr:bifunctional 4-hydroxy-2-oxoglutarate aldolase/2-dehydro-3-deoxy-phosphogluconate aldolase [Terriglobales bacterium]
MKKEEAIQRIGEIGIIPVIRVANAEEANQAVEAIHAGGIPIIEITMTVPDAPALIHEVARRHGHRVLTGAGTVVSVDQARACLDAGAEFLVSPGLAPAVVQCAHDRGKLAIPGTLSPSEVMEAISIGATLIKVFPCGNVGGPSYLKALRGPFPTAALIPTGGVNVSNAASYLEAGAFALGIGGDLVDIAALRSGHVDKITNAARKLVEIVKSVRDASTKSTSVAK